mmetsp:Transcript_221/g.323  ORF Transcript_221/g.323 Transcript_221/m.323 type:complete len:232 (-) Transcript_221:46-741(-)
MDTAMSFHFHIIIRFKRPRAKLAKRIMRRIPPSTRQRRHRRRQKAIKLDILHSHSFMIRRSHTQIMMRLMKHRKRSTRNLPRALSPIRHHRMRRRHQRSRRQYLRSLSNLKRQILLRLLLIHRQLMRHILSRLNIQPAISIADDIANNSALSIEKHSQSQARQRRVVVVPSTPSILSLALCIHRLMLLVSKLLHFSVAQIVQQTCFGYIGSNHSLKQSWFIAVALARHKQV